MISAMMPDKKNLNESAPRGGALLTITRAEVKAEDQIKANIRPRIKALGLKSPPKKYSKANLLKSKGPPKATPFELYFIRY